MRAARIVDSPVVTGSQGGFSFSRPSWSAPWSTHPMLFQHQIDPFEDQRVEFGSLVKRDIAQLVVDRFFQINGKLVRSPA
jgi:hypothetical protein